MEGAVKKELLRLAKRLRARAEEFERAKDYGRAEQIRVYAAYLEEIAKGFMETVKKSKLTKFVKWLCGCFERKKDFSA